MKQDKNASDHRILNSSKLLAVQTRTSTIEMDKQNNATCVNCGIILEGAGSQHCAKMWLSECKRGWSLPAEPPMGSAVLSWETRCKIMRKMRTPSCGTAKLSKKHHQSANYSEHCSPIKILLPLSLEGS